MEKQRCSQRPCCTLSLTLIGLGEPHRTSEPYLMHCFQSIAAVAQVARVAFAIAGDVKTHQQSMCNRQLSSLRLFNKRIASELENRLITAQEPSSSYVTTMCGSVCCNMIATRYSYKVVSTSPSVYANLYRSLASLSMAVTK